jgi:hypothetical protein
MSNEERNGYEEELVSPPEKERTHRTTVTMTKMYKDGGVVVQETEDTEDIEVCVPEAGVPLAEVGAEGRMTINLGNYESVQLGVFIRLPCVVEEVNDCYQAAKKLVDLHLNKEVAEIRAFRDKRTKEE